MTKPLPPSSPIGSDVSAPPLVSIAPKHAASSQSAGRVSPLRPTRILVTASSREDALVQARQIAGELSRELHPVDLQQVESKYIHETEKKLLALMDAAAEAGAVLFFDEADALFGRRSEVRDAHDRYANLEPAYFLEQIENYPGTVIIGTKEPARLDPALLRRHAFTEHGRG